MEIKTKPTLIVIVGPTAIGKTELSVRLAKELKCEIISADSRQFYKEMSIGTAKPTLEEMNGVRHHFVDFLSIQEDYTAGQFENDVIEKLDHLFEENQFQIMVGGSGLFIDAVVKGFDPMPRDLDIRSKLNSRYEQDGIVPLFDQLKELDPEFSQVVDRQNPMRVIRALEICLVSGSTYTSLRSKNEKVRNFNVVKYVLHCDREILYDRINKRCDIMMETGWELEAKKLHEFKNLNALNTVGYKDLFQLFEGNISKNECVENIKQHTRNFAKRQLTWFRKDKHAIWLDINSDDCYETILENLTSKRN